MGQESRPRPAPGPLRVPAQAEEAEAEEGAKVPILLMTLSSVPQMAETAETMMTGGTQLLMMVMEGIQTVTGTRPVNPPTSRLWLTPSFLVETMAARRRRLHFPPSPRPQWTFGRGVTP